MGILDSVIRTIACDAADCKRQLLFDRKDEKVTFELPENSWVKSTRVVQSADGRNILYCSDVCEVKGTATGTHNIPEPPKVIQTSNPAAIAAAASAAAAARQADAALREGQPGKIQITE